MARAFGLLDQLGDVVEIEARAGIELAGADHERPDRLRPLAGVQPQAQEVVDGLLERLATALHLGLELGGDVFFEGQGFSCL